MGSKALNETMLRYAQAGNLRGVSTCLSKGADADYKQSAVVTIAIYRRAWAVLLLCLRAGATIGEEALEQLREQAPSHVYYAAKTEYDRSLRG